MAMFIKTKAKDGFEYGYSSSEIQLNDWVYNINKDEVQKINDAGEVKKLNNLNKEFGPFIFPIYSTDNPELIEHGVFEDLSDEVWFKRLPEDEKTELQQKYRNEMDYSMNFKIRCAYIRNRYNGVISDAMVARKGEIDKAAVGHAQKGGSFINPQQYDSFVVGANWADSTTKAKTGISKDEIFKLCLDAMDMGMTLRQDQLAGNGGDKSGKEMLTEWFNKLEF